MGSFDNIRTDETLRNVFAKISEKHKCQDKPKNLKRRASDKTSSWNDSGKNNGHYYSYK